MTEPAVIHDLDPQQYCTHCGEELTVTEDVLGDWSPSHKNHRFIETYVECPNYHGGSRSGDPLGWYIMYNSYFSSTDSKHDRVLVDQVLEDQTERQFADLRAELVTVTTERDVLRQRIQDGHDALNGLAVEHDEDGDE